jgi:hypothetical protein
MKATFSIGALALVTLLACNPGNGPGPASGKEQVIFGPQLYLYSLQTQEKSSLEALDVALDSIAENLGGPNADVAMLRQALKSAKQDFKAKKEKIDQESRQMSNALWDAAYLIVPRPPPPPPPCLGCDEFRLRMEDPIVIYHKNDIKASLLDQQGKELVSANSSPAGEGMKGFTKTVLNLKGVDAGGKAVLRVEGPDGLAESEVVIQQQ